MSKILKEPIDPNLLRRTAQEIVTPQEGYLERLFSSLGAPSWALKNAVLGKPVSALKNIGDIPRGVPFLGGYYPRLAEPEERPSYRQFHQKLTGYDPGSTMGFIGDIATDPLMYLTLPASGVSKLAQAGRHITKAGELPEAGLKFLLRDIVGKVGVHLSREGRAAIEKGVGLLTKGTPEELSAWAKSEGYAGDAVNRLLGHQKALSKARGTSKVGIAEGGMTRAAERRLKREMFEPVAPKTLAGEPVTPKMREAWKNLETGRVPPPVSGGWKLRDIYGPKGPKGGYFQQGGIGLELPFSSLSPKGRIGVTLAGKGIDIPGKALAGIGKAADWLKIKEPALKLARQYYDPLLGRNPMDVALIERQQVSSRQLKNKYLGMLDEAFGDMPNATRDKILALYQKTDGDVAKMLALPEGAGLKAEIQQFSPKWKAIAEGMKRDRVALEYTPEGKANIESTWNAEKYMPLQLRHLSQEMQDIIRAAGVGEREGGESALKPVFELRRRAQEEAVKHGTTVYEEFVKALERIKKQPDLDPKIAEALGGLTGGMGRLLKKTPWFKNRPAIQRIPTTINDLLAMETDATKLLRERIESHARTIGRRQTVQLANTIASKPENMLWDALGEKTAVAKQFEAAGLPIPEKMRGSFTTLKHSAGTLPDLANWAQNYHWGSVPLTGSPVMKVLKEYNRYFKGAATAGIPFLPNFAFHFRNAVSGAWMGATDPALGIRTWRSFPDMVDYAMHATMGTKPSALSAKLLTLDAAKDFDALKRLRIGNYNGLEVQKMLKAHGISHGFAASELAAKELRKPTTFQKWFNLPTRMMTGVEQSMRTRGFVELLKSGLSPEHAAERVRAAFIDYRQMTPQNAMIRQVLPFIQYTMKQTPRTLGATIRYPKLAVIPRALMGGQERGAEVVPQDVAEIPHVAIGTSPTGQPQYMTGMGLPYEDLTLFGSGGGARRSIERALGSRMHPLLKTGYEALAGRSTHFGTPFASYIRAPGYAQVGAHLPGVGGPLGRALGYEERTLPSGQIYPTVPGELNVAAQMLPITRQLGNLDKIIDVFFTKRQGLVPNLVNLLTGVRIRTVNEEYEVRRIITNHLKEQAAQGNIGEFKRFFMLEPGQKGPDVSPELTDKVKTLIRAYNAPKARGA